MSKKRVKYWKRNGDPLTDGLVCPVCGAENPNKLIGLECRCEKGKCFKRDAEGKLVWRRSPCISARCEICGWAGVVKCKLFEVEYHNSRCRFSETGWHNTSIKVIKNETPSPLTIELHCLECGDIGHYTIDCVKSVTWVS